MTLVAKRHVLRLFVQGSQVTGTSSQKGLGTLEDRIAAALSSRAPELFGAGDLSSL